MLLEYDMKYNKQPQILATQGHSPLYLPMPFCVAKPRAIAVKQRCHRTAIEALVEDTASHNACNLNTNNQPPSVLDTRQMPKKASPS